MGILLRGCLATLLLHCCAAEFDWCNLTCAGGRSHTMCVYKAGGGEKCKSVKTGVTAEEMKVIVDYHNQLRSKVATGQEATGSQPSAADMSQLQWDEEVAEIAQRWADQCSLPGHDNCRITRDKVEVGQNYAETDGYGMHIERIPTIKELIKAWYDEVQYMTPDMVTKAHFEGPVRGHYTQVVWANTTRVGCGMGFQQEGQDGPFLVRFVCNYKPAGNFVGLPIYTVGEPASKCVKKSSKYPALCDTQNGGKSDTVATVSNTTEKTTEKTTVSSTTEKPETPSTVSSTTKKPETTTTVSSTTANFTSGTTAGLSKPIAFAAYDIIEPVQLNSVGIQNYIDFTESNGYKSVEPYNNQPSDELDKNYFQPLVNTVFNPGEPFRSSFISTPHGEESEGNSADQLFDHSAFPVQYTSGFADSEESSKDYNLFSSPMETLDFRKLLTTHCQDK